VVRNGRKVHKAIFYHLNYLGFIIVASSAKINGAFMMSKEQLLTQNPDYIIYRFSWLSLS